MNADEFFIAEEKRCREAFEAGHFASLIELATLFVVNEQPLPLWAGQQLIQIAQAAQKRGLAKGRGRANSVTWTAAEAKKKLMQWDRAHHCMLLLKQQKSQLKGIPRGQKESLSKDKRLRKLLLLNGRFPLTRDGAFEWASELLRQTPWQGSAAVIAASYEAVQKAKKEGRDQLYRAVEGALD